MVSSADDLNWLNAEWRKLLAESNQEGAFVIVARIKAKIETLIRQGSSEFASKILNELIKKIQEVMLSSSSSFEERSYCLLIINSISSVSAEEVSTLIPKFIHIIHLEINGRRDIESIKKAAESLGCVISNSGVLASDLITSETFNAIEKIQGKPILIFGPEFHHFCRLDLKNENNVLSGIITLIALVKSPSHLLMSQRLSNIFDVIWHGLFHSKPIIREHSAELLGSSLSLQRSLGDHGKKDALKVYEIYRSRILDEIMDALRSDSVFSAHGATISLRKLFKLSEEDFNFLLHNEMYPEILDSAMRMIYSKDSTLKQAAIDFVPYLTSRQTFSELHLSKWISFLIDGIKKDKDRFSFLKALDRTLSFLDAKSIEPYLEQISISLKSIFLLKGKYRDLTDLNSALDCVCTLSKICGPLFQRSMLLLLPAMMSSGLWIKLIHILQEICDSDPKVIFFIEDSLLNEIKCVLTDHECSNENLILAINCIGSFEFSEDILSSSIGRKLIQLYLNNSNSMIRCATAESILNIVCRSLKKKQTLLPQWVSRNAVVYVLSRMVADEDFRMPECVLTVLNNYQCIDIDTLLSHSDCIRPLFIFLGSNSVPLKYRLECADLLGRVTSINFASCLPYYRKLLLQYLSEIECIKSPGVLHRDDSSKLLHRILLWHKSFVAPYAEALLENIILKIEDGEISFAESMLNCISRLVQIKPECINRKLESTISTLSRLIQDQSSNVRRKASLSTLCMVLRKVDRKSIKKDTFISLLILAVSIIKNELDHFVRHEAIRLIGVIGAIDPYMIKSTELSTTAVPSSSDEFSTENLLLMNQNTSPDEFYAKIAVNCLLLILSDQTLSMHQMGCAQAIVSLFRTFGPKSNQFLNQVLPILYPIIQNCPSSSAEFYFQQLSVLVGVVGVHIGPHVSDIINMISGKWDSPQPCYPALLHLINVLAKALKSEFRPFVPKILPAVLTILETDSTGMSIRPFSIQKALQTIAVLGSQISDYAGVVGDALVLILKNSSGYRDIRVAALRSTASICKDVSAVADNPSILQALFGILEGTDDPEMLEYCLDAIVVVALAQGRVFFRFAPLLAPIISRKHIRHAVFEKLITSNLNSPAKLADLTSESLTLMELKISDLTLVSGEVGSPPMGTSSRSLSINEGLLMKSFDPSQCVDREHWFDWVRRLGVELLRESPSPALRSCASLANIYYPLSKELFNAAFSSCFYDMSEESRAECISAVEIALLSPIVPSEVAQQLLNVAEFMERQEKPLPISTKTLGAHAARFHAYAKALYYRELEFTNSVQSGAAPSSQVIEALISLNNQVQQPDAALGVLIHANKSHGIVLKESWYEKLQRWDEALKAYEQKWEQDQSSYDAIFGILRCRHALGEWDELNSVAQEIWTDAQDSIRTAIAPLAAASAWGLQDWSHLQQYTTALKPDSADSVFFRSILSIYSNDIKQARSLIDKTRDVIDTELTALLSESYSRAYSAVVRVQMLTELEEISEFLHDGSSDECVRKSLTQNWIDRLELSQSNVEVWLRILKVRSLVMSPQSDPGIWIKFASMCRKSGRYHLSRRILIQLMNKSENEQIIGLDERINLKRLILRSGHTSNGSHGTDPQVIYAYLKYLWECGDDQYEALSAMKFYSRHLSQLPETVDNSKLLARCYHKSSNWEKQLLTDNSTEDQYKSILDGYLAATSYDKTWHKAWHGWALMNFEMSSAWERKNTSTGLVTRSGPSRINPYIVPAIQGFFRSISLSKRDSLQDSLRLLTLWFKYGTSAEINAAVGDGFFTVPVDNWLQVIPQLIARIHVTSPQVRRLVHQVLSDIGRHHPQALVYSLAVAAKSQNVTRRSAAVAILDKMRAHAAILVDQALLVGQELIRVAILWEEMWHEALEEGSKLYFGDHNIPAMFGILEPMHEMLEKGSKSAREAAFVQIYGSELKDARDLCIRYKQTGNTADLNAAWDLYYQVFRRINKVLPTLKGLNLEEVSPKMLNCRNLDLAIPGTYRSDREVIRITSIDPRIGVIASKQRPRKLVMYGSDGAKHQFLLKGHEDLRQDERVMQLFVLINALLKNDPETHKRHLAIERFSVIPLSQNTGLISWLPNCDTMHTLIKNYRESRGIPLSMEHRSMLAFAPDYDHLSKMQKMEVFSDAMRSTDGGDLARAFWLLSGNAEAWLERRINFSRSLAVMSMTGYVLGLGDRHPSNLMFSQTSGKIVHIDFGDCFEVAMQRDRFPEKVPFRLTRMLVRAMEASGVEGTFRITCEETMRVLRLNKDSVMAVLEAFVYDPLINWRLLGTNTTTTTTLNNPTNLMDSNSPPGTLKSFTAREANSWAQFPENFSNSRKIRRGSEISQLEEESLAKPEILNSGAISVINRVSSKLTGKDFRDMKPGRSRQTEGLDDFKDFPRGMREEWPLAVRSQVDRLIEEATRVQNLCQSYVGWCPFW